VFGDLTRKRAVEKQRVFHPSPVGAFRLNLHCNRTFFRRSFPPHQRFTRWKCANTAQIQQ
jgi:hypothetical protein